MSPVVDGGKASGDEVSADGSEIFVSHTVHPLSLSPIHDQALDVRSDLVIKAEATETFTWSDDFGVDYEEMDMETKGKMKKAVEDARDLFYDSFGKIIDAGHDLIRSLCGGIKSHHCQQQPIDFRETWVVTLRRRQETARGSRGAGDIAAALTCRLKAPAATLLVCEVCLMATAKTYRRRRMALQLLLLLEGQLQARAKALGKSNVAILVAASTNPQLREVWAGKFGFREVSGREGWLRGLVWPIKRTEPMVRLLHAEGGEVALREPLRSPPGVRWAGGDAARGLELVAAGRGGAVRGGRDGGGGGRGGSAAAVAADRPPKGEGGRGGRQQHAKKSVWVPRVAGHTGGTGEAGRSAEAAASAPEAARDVGEGPHMPWMGSLTMGPHTPPVVYPRPLALPPPPAPKDVHIVARSWGNHFRTPKRSRPHSPPLVEGEDTGGGQAEGRAELQAKLARLAEVLPVEHLRAVASMAVDLAHRG